jgi:rfaE bifunctional protein nucleotidyltransferase chain/domain
MAQALAAGAVPSEAVVAATQAATEYVAAGGVSGVERAADRPAADPIDGVRRRGGKIVATGGCFDLLHPGHLLLLDRARSLGDCLVVCLNSDASVRALKGDGRPVHPVEERRMMLEHLRAVDAVVVFDEPTPEAALRRLRPDVFVKGGDYAEVSLPERDAVETGGGRVVVLPYVGGHSTTRILEEVRHGG